MKKTLMVITVILNLVLINSCKKEPPVTAEILYTLQGKVLDMKKGTPIPGASISLGGAETFSDSGGYFTYKNLINNKYTFSVSHPKYETYSQDFTISGDTSLSLYLKYKGTLFTLIGRVQEAEEHTNISGALVSLGTLTDSTDSFGFFRFDKVESGEYTLTITDPLYVSYNQNIILSSDIELRLNLLIRQIEFFSLKLGETKYNYSYDKTHGSPRPTSTKARGIATWAIIEIFKRDNNTVYNVLETVVDTVEQWDYYGGTLTSSGTWTQYFEILEDSNYVLTSAKFPDNISIPRYIRADDQKNNLYYSSSNGYINVSKDIGIINILKAWGIISPNTNGEYIGYTLIK